MIVRRGWSGAFVAAVLAWSSHASAAEPSPKTTAAPANAVPSVEAFARLPYIEHPVLSPDGNWMAGLAAVGGKQVIAAFDLFTAGKPPVAITVPEGTQARWVRWVNRRHIVVGFDALTTVQEDRFYVSRAAGVHVTTGKVSKLLWELNGQSGSDILWMPSDETDDILMAAQNSVYLGPDFWRSVYRVNVATGRKQRVVSGSEGVTGWSADSRGKVRAGIGYNTTSRGFRLLYRGESGEGSFRTIASADSRKRESLIEPFLFLPGTDHALAVHDDPKGRSAIYEVDLLTQKDVRTVFEMPAGEAEVDRPILSQDGGTLLGVAGSDAGESLHWIDPQLAELQRQFDKAVPDATVRIVSFSRDRQRMLVRVGAADMPGSIYFYDVAGGRLQRIAILNDQLGTRRLSPVRLVRYKARDGLEIEAVLTLPKGVAKPRNLPFVVMPHGGPWAQDTLSYDYWAQFIASRGYAVLQPNFRGSTGYGTDFLRRGEGQLGLAMQDDVSDGVAWAVAEHIADPKRVCIVGASYGGYAAMWGLVKDPDLYRCAIAIAGVSSLRREVNDFGNMLLGGKFRDDWKRMTPDFDAVSPYNAVDRIKAPLLLIHGRKDVTVDVSQSSRMFTRMQKAGKAVDYVPLDQADHYFTRQADRVALLTAIGAFLTKHNPATH